MKIFTIMFAALFMLLSTGCSNPSEEQKQEDVAIELNNGKKWAVNSEMTPYILEAEQILLAYNGTEYEELAEQLEQKNKGLIQSCTMKGKSHDELHKWLHPHMQLIEALDNAESKEDADRIIAELKGSFQTYHKFFQ